MTAPFDLDVTDRLLSTTRAVRRRLDLDRPVERAVLLDCIRLAQQAPPASNTQRWRWLVVDDAEKRPALAALYGDALALRATQHHAIVVGGYNRALASRSAARHNAHGARTISNRT